MSLDAVFTPLPDEYEPPQRHRASMSIEARVRLSHARSLPIWPQIATVAIGFKVPQKTGGADLAPGEPGSSGGQEIPLYVWRKPVPSRLCKRLLGWLNLRWEA